MTSVSLLLDVGIILLLGVVIAYAVVLNRRLSAFRSAKAEMERLLALGVDGVMSDFPGLLAEVAAAHRARGG